MKTIRFETVRMIGDKRDCRYLSRDQTEPQQDGLWRTINRPIVSHEYGAALPAHRIEFATPHPSSGTLAAPVDTIVVDGAIAAALHAVSADIIVSAGAVVVDGAVTATLHAISADVLAIAAIIVSTGIRMAAPTTV